MTGRRRRCRRSARLLRLRPPSAAAAAAAMGWMLLSPSPASGAAAASAEGRFFFRPDVVRGTSTTTTTTRSRPRRKPPSSPSSYRSADDELSKRAVPLEKYRRLLSEAASSSSAAVGDRRLEDGGDDEADEDEDGGDDYYMDENDLLDFSSYSLKYAKCQPVQRFSGNAVANGEYSALLTDDVVILRLCPVDSCDENSQYGCKNGYGEYVVGLSQYLDVRMKHDVHRTENLCGFCRSCGYNGNNGNNGRRGRRAGRRRREDGGDEEDDGNDEEEGGDEGGNDDGGGNDDEGDNGDDGGGGNDDAAAEEDAYDDDDDDDAAAYDDDDDDYVDPCYTYQDLCYDYSSSCNHNDDDDDGDGNFLPYEDYANYFDCVEVQDDYYVAARCDAASETIKMAIFYDPYCEQYAGNEVNLNDYAGVYFRQDVFEEYYGGECIECAGGNDQPPYYNANSNMCNKMYEKSGKCDAYLSVDGAQQQDDDGNDDDSYGSNDDQGVVCNFIESIRNGAYDTDGKIVVRSKYDNENAEEKVTPAQTFGVIFTGIICVALALYSCYLHHEITNHLLKSLSHGRLISRSSSGSGGRRGRSSSSSRGRVGRSTSGSRGSRRAGGTYA